MMGEQLSPITTVTVFRFPPRSRVWAFSQMAFARPLLSGVPGLRFHRLMGAGRGLGFTLAPDWGRYALLAVWESHERAAGFLAGAAFMRRYRRKAASESTVVLRTLSANGAWDRRNPFLPAIDAAEAGSGEIAVLTRATIRPSRLGAFWRQVPVVSEALRRAPGLVWSIGIGEAPLLRQATLSVWRDADAVRDFAYASGPHREVVRRTRAERWYSEDLFARFSVLDRTDLF